MQRTVIIVSLAFTGLFARTALADRLSECRGISEEAQRLKCYDALPGTGTAPQPPAIENSAAAPVTTEADASTAGNGTTNMGGVAQTFTTAWELTQELKRGTFVVRTNLPNYLLPAHYTWSINRAPYSPTHEAPEVTNHYRRLEAKLQISLRTKVLEDFLLPQADLWLSYTQLSMWQVWNQKDSAPFRSIDYQPEALYVIPVPAQLATLPLGWHWSMVQLGIAHQSNGQSDPLSRSWNRVYAGVSVERGEVGVLLHQNFRLSESPHTDDNPDLTDYIGTTDATLAWLPGRATAALTWKLNTGYLSRGSLQFDWTYPVRNSQPQGLRWYVQLFTGYGETLLDYNHRQTTVGVGVSLFQL